MKTLAIRRPDDFHVHLRNGDMLENVAKFTERHFARALVMPNTMPPIVTAEQIPFYRREIKQAAPNLEPLMTIKLTMRTTPETIEKAMAAGAIAAKMYPEGVTTNSNDAVSSIESLYPVFGCMEYNGMVLCIHGELPEGFVLDREWAFLETLEAIHQRFPALRIVLEHVTTDDAVQTVKRLPPNVAATITVHHLMITLDDVVGGFLQPHHFCKPIPKRDKDLVALVEAATSGNPKFFLGTDSAPHLKENKECGSGCAGVFTAPVALACLAKVFEDEESLDRLEDFTSTFGANFYGLPLNEGQIVLVKHDNDDGYVVDHLAGGVVPFMAGKRLQWWVSQNAIRKEQP